MAASLVWCAPHPIPLIKTPLLVAAQKGRVDVAALLLDRGAAVNASMGDGTTSLHGAIPLIKTPLQVAVPILMMRAWATAAVPYWHR